MKSVIAIPCYNCSEQVTRVIEGLLQNNLNTKSIILLIDNRSTDNTTSSILNCIKDQDNFILVQNEENFGLGGSHKVAFEYAIQKDMDFITILHGDDQATIQDLIRLQEEAIIKNRTVLGSRFLKNSKRINYQTSRVIGNKALNIVFTLLTRHKTKDLGSGLNVFRISDIKQIDFISLTNSFNFNVELLLNFYSKKINFLYSPITWIESDQVSNARNFRVAFDMLKSLTRWLFNMKQINTAKKYNYKILNK